MKESTIALLVAVVVAAVVHNANAFKKRNLIHTNYTELIKIVQQCESAKKERCELFAK